MRSMVWQEVEKLQIKLHETINKKGLKSPESLKAIQAFKDKMNEYKQYEFEN